MYFQFFTPLARTIFDVQGRFLMKAWNTT